MASLWRAGRCKGGGESRACTGAHSKKARWGTAAAGQIACPTRLHRWARGPATIPPEILSGCPKMGASASCMIKNNNAPGRTPWWRSLFFFLSKRRPPWPRGPGMECFFCVLCCVAARPDSLSLSFRTKESGWRGLERRTLKLERLRERRGARGCVLISLQGKKKNKKKK